MNLDALEPHTKTTHKHQLNNGFLFGERNAIK